MPPEADVNLDREVMIGGEAKALLENELLRASLDAIIASHDRTWKDSKLNEVEKREDCYRMLRAAGEFKMLLTRLVSTGSMATEQLEQQIDEARRLKEIEEEDGSRSGYNPG